MVTWPSWRCFRGMFYRIAEDDFLPVSHFDRVVSKTCLMSLVSAWDRHDFLAVNLNEISRAHMCQYWTILRLKVRTLLRIGFAGWGRLNNCLFLRFFCLGEWLSVGVSTKYALGLPLFDEAFLRFCYSPIRRQCGQVSSLFLADQIKLVVYALNWRTLIQALIVWSIFMCRSQFLFYLKYHLCS
jgi:hypothetical protein